jgi:hypothetical protein
MGSFALLTVFHCSRHPAVSRPAPGRTGWRVAEPMTRPGPRGSHSAVSMTNCLPPKNSKACRKWTNLCPN